MFGNWRCWVLRHPTSYAGCQSARQYRLDRRSRTKASWCAIWPSWDACPSSEHSFIQWLTGNLRDTTRLWSLVCSPSTRLVILERNALFIPVTLTHSTQIPTFAAQESLERDSLIILAVENVSRALDHSLPGTTRRRYRNSHSGQKAMSTDCPE